jgi:hypothetical protein
VDPPQRSKLRPLTRTGSWRSRSSATGNGEKS